MGLILLDIMPEKWAEEITSFKTKYETIKAIEDVQNTYSDADEAIAKLNELKVSIGKLNQDPDVLAAFEDAYNDVKSINDEKKEKQSDSNIEQTNQQIRELNTSLEIGSEELKKASEVMGKFDDKYDKYLGKGAKVITGDSNTEYIATWAKVKFGEEVFNSCSVIKNGAKEALDGVNSLLSLKQTFSGSWRDPDVAKSKINNGLKAIQQGVDSIAKFSNDLIEASTGKKSVILNKINLSSDSANKILTPVAGVIATGIGSFNAIKTGDYSKAIDVIKDGFSSVKKSRATKNNSDEEQPKDAFDDSTSKSSDTTGKENEETKNNLQSSNYTDEHKPSDSEINYRQGTSQEASANSNDDFSADMISEINVVLDGSSSSQNSFCTINGEKYKLSSYSLSQELLQPMILDFSIEKENKIETQSDVIFADTTQIIGKSFEINVSTIKTSHEDSNAKPQKAFVFKGMIIDVSASRATASSQSASVTVATWDALLQNAPHCRSFENMTLKEIIDSVLKPYSDIKSKISPRFKDKIPYIVQYNQSDYVFIRMLAIRFGEWMYNTGETFIFGEMDDSNSSSANLEYPGGSLMSYNLHQSMTSFSFNHLLPDYYQYGNEKAILKESAQGIADGSVNNWTDKAFNASMQRFNNEQISALNTGGFDSGKEDEGADSILDYSLKIEAEGKKTGIMTVHGLSKLAMLKIGQTFLIRDNVQNKSGESKDVEQKALKIIGINHSFDYRQEYSNSFTAVPVACNYPSYSDADVFPSAPQQRAKVVENKDEQKLGRIRVQFPWQEIQSKDMKTPWLRIAVPYAGASKGQQFVPEIGEEVMVGFEMNNAERPYIIGSFYNGGNGKPDENWAVSKEEDGTSNNIKAIRTRNGHTILFNDKGDAGLLEIYDNKNNTYHITLSADDKKITIYSAGNVEVVAKNNINVSADGNIDVIAKGDIGVNADGDIGIKAKGNISMEAKKEVSIQASKVKVR